MGLISPKCLPVADWGKNTISENPRYLRAVKFRLRNYGANKVNKSFK